MDRGTPSAPARIAALTACLLACLPGGPAAAGPGDEPAAANVAPGSIRADLLLLLRDLEEACRRDGAPGAALLARVRQLEGRVDVAELELLRAACEGRPAVRPYLGALLRAAYRSVHAGCPPERLLELGRHPDPRVRRLAVSALVERLAPLRLRVEGGGALTPAERAFLADPRLVRLLIERLEDRRVGLDRLPAGLAAATPGSATALHGLVLIEEPARAALALAREEGRPGAAEALAALEAARAGREARQPQSTWWSGTPVEAPTAGSPLTSGEARR